MALPDFLFGCCIFAQQQNAMGSLRNIGAVLGRNRVLGTGSGKPGSGPEGLPRFRVQQVACARFRRFRCSMGSTG